MVSSRRFTFQVNKFFTDVTPKKKLKKNLSGDVLKKQRKSSVDEIFTKRARALEKQFQERLSALQKGWEERNFQALEKLLEERISAYQQSFNERISALERKQLTVAAASTTKPTEAITPQKKRYYTFIKREVHNHIYSRKL